MINNEKGFAHLLVIALIATTVGGVGTAATSNSARPGDMLYGIDKAVESVQGGFAIGQTNKAEHQAVLAEERLTELRSLVDSNADLERIEQARARYQENLEKALTKAEAAKQNGKDVSELMELLTRNSLRQAAVLQEVYDKVPEQAKESILKAQEASQRGFEQSSAAISKERAEAIRSELRGEYPGIDNLINSQNRPDFPHEAQDARDRADQVHDHSGDDGTGDHHSEPHQ